MKFEKISESEFIKALDEYSKEENLTPDEYLKSLQYFREKMPLPTRGTKFSSGYDFYVPVPVYRRPPNRVDIPTGYDFPAPVPVYRLPTQVVKIPTGIKVELDEDKFLMMVPRSSSYKRGYMLANTVGIVDSDYYNNESNEGNIYLMITNLDRFFESKSNDFKLCNIGDRLVQGIIVSYNLIDDDDTKKVRTGGYGSTDK